MVGSVLSGCLDDLVQKPHNAWFNKKGFGDWGRCLGRSRTVRGPAMILLISRDTCSDRIATLFCACFYGVSHNYRAICSKLGYRTDVLVGNSVPRGRIAPFWRSADLPEKVSRDTGYHSDSIAISRDNISARAPLCCKNMCCASRFCTDGRGAVGSRSKQTSTGP